MSTQAEKLDLIKAASAAVAAGTLALGVWTFLVQQKARDEERSTREDELLKQHRKEEEQRRKDQERHLDQRDRELSQKFREDQFSLYMKALEATSAIAVAKAREPRSGRLNQAIAEFWQLYWGKLALVESRGVVDAMVAFGQGLNKCESDDELCGRCLKHLSLALAHQCRKSVSESWHQQLEGLPKPTAVEECVAWATKTP